MWEWGCKLYPTTPLRLLAPAASRLFLIPPVTFHSFTRITSIRNGRRVILHQNELMTEREYNDCVTNYADNVYRFILKNLRNEEDARDVVQSAFEKMWRNRENVEILTAKSYLFTIAHNQMIDHLRKVKRVSLKEEFKETEKITEQQHHNLKKVLNEALNRLNETQRSLVMLKDYEGYSYEEIGRIMGLSESQVKVYLHRARIQLKNYLVKPENVI
jgi:RNA polymerase sigma-70 factor (ECF subfamily)